MKNYFQKFMKPRLSSWIAYDRPDRKDYRPEAADRFYWDLEQCILMLIPQTVFKGNIFILKKYIP